MVEEHGRLTAVDAGLPGYANQLEADLAALGHALADIEAVVLTHADGDHTGVAAALQKAGARVLVHGDDQEPLRTGALKSTDGGPPDLVRSLYHPTPYQLFAHFVRNGGIRPTKVDGAESFGEGDVLDVPGAPRVIATPGHTRGHCVLLFEQHAAMFVGDQLCTLNPLTGATGPQLMPKPMNTSTPQSFQSLARLDDLEAAAVLPGHGEPWLGSVAGAVARARAAYSG